LKGLSAFLQKSIFPINFGQ